MGKTTRVNEFDRRRTKSDVYSVSAPRRPVHDHDDRTTTQLVDTRLKLQSSPPFKSRVGTALDARALIKDMSLEKKRIVIEIAQDLNDRNRHKTDTLAEISDNDQELYSINGRKRPSGPEPVIYVTGLSNFEHDGDKLKSLKNNTENKRRGGSDHVRDRDYRARDRHHSNQDVDFVDADEVIEIDRRKKLASTVVANNSKYSNIRIKIDNEKSTSNGRVEVNRSSGYNNGSSRKDRHDSDAESMDYQEPGTVSSVVYKPANIDLHNNSGHRVVVSNLHPKVTEDDILELFSDIGPIKRARFLDKGIAEVIYVKLDDARDAISKYHRNELDGRPMIIELIEGEFNLIAFKRQKEDEERRRASVAASSIPAPVESTNHQHPSTVAASIHQPVTSKYQVPPSSKYPTMNTKISISQSPSQEPKSQRTSSKTTALASVTQITSLSDKFKSFTNETFILPDSVSHLTGAKNPGAKVDRIDSTIISQILFNTKPVNAPTNPVTFTVKI